MKKVFIKRNAFTLVELLIVIVVIGILTTMMMLASAEMAATAEAAKVVTNLEEWKMAAMMWYTNNIDKVNEKGRIKRSGESGGKFTGLFIYNKDVKAGEIYKYLDNGNLNVNPDGTVKDDEGGIYYTDYYSYGTITDSQGDTKTRVMWLIVYKLGDKNYRVQKKIEARAARAGIINKVPGGASISGLPSYQADSNGPDTVYVAIKVLDFGE